MKFKMLLSPDAAPGAGAIAAEAPSGVKVKANGPFGETIDGQMCRVAKGDVVHLPAARVKALGDLVTVIKVLLLAALLGFSGPAARAQQYTYQVVGPFNGSSTIIPASAATNLTAVNTNSAASNCVVTLTKWDSFDLDISWTPMAGASNEIVIAWESSADGTSWPTALTGATNSAFKSWFRTLGADATNSAGLVYFRTNITTPYGYWRCVSVTNTAAVVISNVTLRAWVKPLRYGGFGP